MAQTKISSYIDETTANSDLTNQGVNDTEASSAAKTTLETTLSDATNNIVARVITRTGNYLKVKWFRNGKVFGTFKSRKYDQDRALTSLEYLKTNSAGISAPSTMAVTGTNTTTVAGTQQWVATITRADASTSIVTSQATWTSASPTKATVSATGLVTGVQAGTSVITATYGGVSNTRTMTVS